MAMRRWIWLGIVVMLVAAFAAACGGGGQQGGGQPSGTPEGAAAADAEEEWTLQVPSSTMKPGKGKALINNEGTIHHHFLIQGTSVGLQALPPRPPKGGTR